MGMVEETHPDHVFYQLMTEPADAGHAAMARLRTYIIGSHRERTACLYDPYLLQDRVSTSICAQVHTRPSDYLVAARDEVLQEAMAVAEQRRIPYRLGCTDLRYLLLPREIEAARALDKEYWERFGRDPCEDADLCYFLGDSPWHGRTWSAVSGKVPTFRMNCSTAKYWFPRWRRWLTPKEKLALMGFPVVPEMATSMMVGLFPSTEHARAAQVCGNAMHFASVALMQLLSLVCFGPNI